jgi:hypothetical protein
MSAAPGPRKRPLLLLAGMLLCTLMAMAGSVNGFTELVHFRSGTVAEAPLTPGVDAADQEAAQRFVHAWGEALDRARSVRLPLSVANMLLSGLLLIAATRASAGRPGSGSLALQAVGANAALAVVDYLLSRHYRGDVVAASIEYLTHSKLWDGSLTEAQLASRAWTSFRVQLCVALVAYGAAALSLVRRPAREFLAPVDSPPDDDEADSDD